MLKPFARAFTNDHKYKLTILCTTSAIHQSSPAAGKVVIYDNLQPSKILVVYVTIFFQVTQKSLAHKTSRTTGNFQKGIIYAIWE